MKRKQLIYLFGCIIFISVVLFGIYSSSPLSREAYRGNFERIFLPGSTVTKKGTLDLIFNSFYIAGATKSKIYLANVTAPLLIGVTDTLLGSVQKIKTQIAGLDSVKEMRRFRVVVDSPYYFLLHGNQPQILRGRIENWVSNPIMTDSGYYFVEAVPISSSSLALRSYSTFDQGYELAKKTVAPPYFKFENRLLNKQVDGIFCLDGQLQYSKALNRIVYQHYYRNEFIVSDTNLNLIYRGNTIDTFRTVNIKLAHIGSKTMLSGPPKRTNGKSCVARKYLFINSNILSRNEDNLRFSKGAVIDIYDLTDGRYVSSFHIPNHEGKRPKDFLINGNHLIALFDHYLVLFGLDFSEIEKKAS